MFRFSSILLFITLLDPAAAGAAWALRSGGTQKVILIAASSPTPDLVFTAGFHIDTSGFLPTLVSHVYSSDNGGRTVTEITGTLGTGGSFEVPGGLYFVDAEYGWVGKGSSVFRTTSGGYTWVEVDVGANVNALHFFSRDAGVLVASGGAIKATNNGGVSWTAMSSGTVIDLTDMFWLDNNRAWVVGYETYEDIDPDSGETWDFYRNGFVLSTTDGGISWAESAPIPDLGLGSLFFLDDGSTGWLAAFKRVSGDTTDAHLLKTTDGGQSFVDTDLPIDVGTTEMMGFQIPLRTASVNAIFWSDANHGHLGGSAFIAKTSSSGGGGGTETKIWRTVDYITEDGGATWQKTDLGTIQLSFQGGTTPQNDGALTDSVMHSQYDGLMVGEKKSVWGYNHICNGPSDCAPGYSCSAEGACEPDVSSGSCVPTCQSDERCDNGSCVPKSNNGTSGSGSGSGASGTGGTSNDVGGCDCNATPPILPFTGAAFALLLIRRRQRRR